MSRNVTTPTLVVLLLIAAIGPAAADDRRGGEIGIVLGALAADEEMTGDSSSAEPEVGFRAGTVFSSHWGWYVDGLYSNVATENGLGDARTVIGRSGLDYLFTPHRRARWLATVGLGWMVVDYEDAAFEDFHNPIASVGFGQRIRLGGNTRMRWELRGDTTLDDARLEDDLVQAHALLAFTWGPGGVPEGQDAVVAGDEDRDGVRDRRDRCPGTPAGAAVDDQGCSADADRDGVPNGVDRCPRTKAGQAVGPDGCPADGDGDGVGDISDACPATPQRAQVDEWGCPKDGDADGVYDGIDECPETPWAARVDASGCPSDRDGDGVFDGRDRCPDSAPGASVGPDGCVPDADGDGVPDASDACPDTPAGATGVDARGCVRTAPVFEEGQTQLVLEGVGFETDSATLTPDSREVLDRVARSLADHADVRVIVGGHTDSVGDADYNLALSGRRAEAVRDYLIGRGISAARMTARGFGETEPLADNATPGGRATNRRVELIRR